MSEPTTLLQRAGLSLGPARLAEATLIVIDAQAEYAAGGGVPLAGIDAALACLADLLARARAAGAPVVHVVHRGRPGGLFDGERAAILPEAAPLPGEAAVAKTLPNAFTGTHLAAHLTRHGRRDLVLAGFMTHNCVSATARAALDLGYRVTVAADATATRDLPDPLGGAPLTADAIQRAELAALADRTAHVAAAAAVV
ncbi:isochorismatase family protein [Methylobacterium oryzihabitans]|uniref:Isochorismatase family protein n=1 Tax=Methylobacterium oryzihabitans TaxID=2499852 RepID=A0A437P726_9HYPH|nr:isochorismatase family protein [Methylobacterium oryzihabitans]RVU18091.1 isochorismatase family protein [Methylobacterium oryzihabitans]